MPLKRSTRSSSDLVVIEFSSEAKAEEVRQKLLDMQNEYLTELEDAVIAVKQPNGRIKLNRIFPALGQCVARSRPSRVFRRNRRGFQGLGNSWSHFPGAHTR